MATKPNPLSGSIADWRKANEGRAERNPGCGHGMRFTPEKCTVCAS